MLRITPGRRRRDHALRQQRASCALRTDVKCSPPSSRRSRAITLHTQVGGMCCCLLMHLLWCGLRTDADPLSLFCVPSVGRLVGRSVNNRDVTKKRGVMIPGNGSILITHTNVHSRIFYATSICTLDAHVYPAFRLVLYQKVRRMKIMCPPPPPTPTGTRVTAPVNQENTLLDLPSRE